MFLKGEQIVNSNMVAMETKKAKVLTKVLHYTKSCWPDKLKSELQPYFSKRLELATEKGILLWYSRVVIPDLCGILLEDLHTEHLGMGKMKQLACECM